MPSEQVQRAQALRDSGLSFVQIAEALGVGRSTVYGWLNPDYGERARAKKRAWRVENRAEARAYDREYKLRKANGESLSRPESPFERLMRENS